MPDDMALALAVAASAILLKAEQTRATLVGSALLFLAALIKSPIPFVFVVFFAVQSLLNRDGHRNAYANAKMLIPLVVALAGALLAEKIRKYVLETDVGGFAQDPTWYFGTIHQRLSLDFWLKIPKRFVKSNPLVVVLAFPAAYYCLRTAPREYAALGVAFLTGWLVFANVYLIHDYYEMPVDVVAYVLLAIGAQTTYAAFVDVRWAESVLLVRNIGLAVIALLCIIYMPKQSSLSTVSIYDSMTFALRDERKFLWVNDDHYSAPEIGGRVGTQFEQMSHAAIEKSCASVVAAHRAILVRGHSDCLTSYKASASTYIEDGGFQFYLRKDR